MHSHNRRRITPWHTIEVPVVSRKGTSEACRKRKINKPPGWILDEPDVTEQINRTAQRLCRRCGHSQSDLEDIAQDIRAHLIEKESMYDPARASVGGYVHVLLNSFVKMRIRYRLQQRRRGRLSTQLLVEEEALDVLPDSGIAVDSIELRDILAACLDRLTPDEVQFIILVYSRGQSHASRILGVSRRQLRNKLHLISETCADLAPFRE